MFQVRYKSRHYYKVKRSVSHDLVGNADVTALGELGFGNVHEEALFSRTLGQCSLDATASGKRWRANVSNGDDTGR
jgi:hypothetical protein